MIFKGPSGRGKGKTMKQKSIIVALDDFHLTANPQTISFLESIGFTTDQKYRYLKLVVELKEMPGIFVKINEYEKSNEFKFNKEWTLSNIGQSGILIYHIIMRDQPENDGHIFIPMSNVVSITSFNNF